MKQNTPETQPSVKPPEDKLSKIRRLAQSEPSAYSSAEDIDASIKQQRDDWVHQNIELVSKI